MCAERRVRHRIRRHARRNRRLYSALEMGSALFSVAVALVVVTLNVHPDQLLALDTGLGATVGIIRGLKAL